MDARGLLRLTARLTGPGPGTRGSSSGGQGQRGKAAWPLGWGNPPIPWRELERRLSWRRPGDPAITTGDQPAGEQPAPPGPPPASPEAGGPEWAELHCHSSYSFLDGASSPADLVAEAAERGLVALAITDHDGMYGVPQFAQAPG